MAKLIQYRCPKCLKLLFKFDKETGKIEYHTSQYGFESDEKGNAKYVKCDKCFQSLEITKKDLIAVTHNFVTPPDIVAPVLERPTQQRSTVWQKLLKWLKLK